MIESGTKAAIKGYLEGFIRGLIEQHRPEARRPMVDGNHASRRSHTGVLKPFHEAIVPPEILRISAFERSFSTRLGITFEECARLIALQTYEVAERGYKVGGTMSAAAAARIEEVVSRINDGAPPDFPALIDDVLHTEGGGQVERPVVADLYLRDKAGREYFFEIKSPRPNKGQCLEVTERLLRAYAIRGQGPPQVNAYFAMAYNPYGDKREFYRHSFSLRYLDMEHEVLLGPEFWTLVGGEGTYEELLEIYREVGREFGKTVIDALAFGFYH